MAKQAKQHRPLFLIAQDVRENWVKVSPYALPYLNAMAAMDEITDNYGMESGDMIVRYFLTNASSWRGDKAREIKKELKGML